jgi:chemotaxis methyl-accepting protein methylase
MDSKNRALNHLYKSLKTGGFLITGYAESLYQTLTPLKYVQPTLYSRA